MRLVVLESPYAGEVARNVEYARRAMRDSLVRGEYPFASHLLYTQPGVLDDTKPEEREKGINAGFSWALQAKAEASAFYCDYGVSSGMLVGFFAAKNAGRAIEIRLIGRNPGDIEPPKPLDIIDRVIALDGELWFSPDARGESETWTFRVDLGDSTFGDECASKEDLRVKLLEMVENAERFREGDK